MATLKLHERAEQLIRPFDYQLEQGFLQSEEKRLVAAIESALRDVVEACAKVSEKYEYDEWHTKEPGDIIAAAIRRLKEEG